MDSLTHIALGACMGDAFAGKQLGKRAMLLGAVAQSVPDVDFLASFWTSESENLLAHRGFTHSILFALLISVPLGMIAERWRRPHDISLKKWIAFFAIQAFIHLLLDGMNAYGVGWFEPFSHYRVSYNWIFVADPLYSIWLGIAFTALLILRNKHPKRKWWIRFGVGMSTIYLLYCGLNKMKIDHDVKTIFHKQQIAYNSYFTTPTPFNNWLWFVVASNDSGYYIGYRSVFDKEKQMDLLFLPRNDTAMTPYLDSTGKEDLRNLVRFSQGYYAIQYWGDTLVFNDLRFGQMIGWRDLHARFAFYYFLQYPGDNELLVQRGRFKGWNREALLSLLRRIKGN
ncbi:MAG TPA: metal-dependent hydrolase [Chitinophagaceae bacterium]|jgi:inner membrane protein|nr:metal-dependent hydrolase [Chitinophagaceae bacterium]